MTNADSNTEPNSKLSPTDWVQAISSIVLVCGLLLVIFELKQARDIAEAQFDSEESFMALGIETAVMGESAALVLAKACEQPQELTKADGEVMVAWLRSQLSRAIRITRTDRKGLSTADAPRLIELAGRFYLGTEYGRFEWEKLRVFPTFAGQYPEIVKIFDEIYQSYSGKPVGWCSWGSEQEEYLNRFNRPPS